MGRYRGGHRHRNHWHRDKKQSSSYQGMSESDLLLVEKYLIKYRSKAFECLNIQKSDQTDSLHFGQGSYSISTHLFDALTPELCKQPYIDLPNSLSPKERRHIHALCNSLDLYHCGVGTKEEQCKQVVEASDEKSMSNATKKRRIVVSIYANGFDYVPDLESSQYKTDFFPSRKCRPWYKCAYSALKCDSDGLRIKYTQQLTSHKETDTNPYYQRIITIEEEKRLISQYSRYPEQSLRTSLRKDMLVSCESNSLQSQIDTLDLGELESVDLSIIPTPKQVPYMYVDTVEKLKECVRELMFGLDNKIANTQRSPLLHELAFDLEMFSHSTGEKKTAFRTCLIQLTSNVALKDYVIDPLAHGVWDAISVFLGPLFSDASVVKIGHGISGMDTTSLHKDFGILIVNAFDTYEASTVLAGRRKGGLGLAALCKHYGLPSWKQYTDLKYKYQSSNWSKRPLEEDALEYGRTDVRYLIMLRKLLMRDLVKMDMIDDKIHFAFTQNNDSENNRHNVLSTQTSFIDSENSTNRSFNESSLLYEASTSDPSSEVSSFFDLSKDTIKNIDELGIDDRSKGESVDAREPFSLLRKHNQVLHAADLPVFRNLMQAIKLSNKRCLCLWDGDEEEDASTHPLLLSMIEQSKAGKGQGKFWVDSHYKLYISLAEWRLNVASQEGIDACDVCSLDFLVYIAYKLPLDRFEMRRFAYFLPEILEDENLPYFEILRDLIARSDAFQLQTHHPLSEMERFDLVFYKDHKKCQRKKLMLVTVAVAASIATVMLVKKTRGR